MKRRKVHALLMILIMLITCIGIYFLPNNDVVKAEESGSVQVNVHYHRYDDAYDGWNLWLWPYGGDGSAYEFNGEDDFGKVCSTTISASADQIGLIVRLNEWESKDCDVDRFIDISNAVNGTIDVYLVQGDEEVYYSNEGIDLSPRFLSAIFNKATEIQFSVTKPLECNTDEAVSKFTVKDEDGNSYPIKKIYSTEDISSKAFVIMEDSLDMGKSYVLESEEYGETGIAMGNVFTTQEFEDEYTYEGDDLGAVYSKDKTDFRLWAPTASKVILNLFEDGLLGEAYKTVEMTSDVNGTWIASETGDLNGVYYTYTVTVNDDTKEAVDPYARTTGANGLRGMVIDLDSTNPEEWENDTKPAFVNPTDAVIYEAHVRDLSIDESSGATNKGKYLGVIEEGTTNSEGLSTGIDYLKELGITHIQLLPIYDYSYNSVDETKLDEPQFNWGYDPFNYNTPEGSYSTDPYNGEVRVNELKQMVQGLHENDIRIVMDVVYNHTAESSDSYFNRLVPNYYYRYTAEGDFSSGSGCGNEIASERSMVRKYIVDSVVYWATEYHIDGFRFDLMGVLDIETMLEVRAALDEIDPSIMLYGEGWAGGNCELSESLRALKKNGAQLGSVGLFSDDIRDGIKGSVFEAEEQGFATGATGLEERIKVGVTGSTNYDGIDWSKVNTDVGNWWAGAPTQTVNYTSCHDNLTLWDKINSSTPDATEDERVKMNLLSAAIVYTSQGIPFMQAGEEILRTKPSETEGELFNENSYKSSDAVNSIKWDTLSDNKEVLEYYQGLIAFRKAHPALRMTTTEDINKNLSFIEDVPENVVAYTIDNKPNGEKADSICVVYNANNEEVTVSIPKGSWKVYINGDQAGTEVIETIKGGKITVDPISTLVLVRDEAPANKVSTIKKVIGIIAGLALVAGVIAFANRKKKK